MKKIFLLFITLWSLTSCSKDLLDVEFTTHLSQTSEEITVNNIGSRNAIGGTFTTEFTLDLSNNQDVEPYLNKIKEINLQDLSLSFQGLENLSENQIATRLEITFDNQISIDIDNFIFSNVANGQEYILTQTTQINEVAQLLLQNKKLNIKIEGNIPDTAIYHFFITLNATANITANPL